MSEWLEGFAVATAYYALATLFAGRLYSSDQINWRHPLAFLWALLYVLLWPLFVWAGKD